MNSGQLDGAHRPAHAGAPQSLQQPLVVMLVHDGIGPFDLAGPLLVFSDNGAAPSPVRFAVCAVEPGLIHTAAGFELKVTHGLELLEQADAVLLPSWPSLDMPVPEPLREALQRAHARGAYLVGLCQGVLVLAECDLLHGQDATTHWARLGPLTERYPTLKLQAQQLYTTDAHV